MHLSPSAAIPDLGIAAAQLAKRFAARSAAAEAEEEAKETGTCFPTFSIRTRIRPQSLTHVA